MITGTDLPDGTTGTNLADRTTGTDLPDGTTGTNLADRTTGTNLADGITGTNPISGHQAPTHTETTSTNLTQGQHAQTKHQDVRHQTFTVTRKHMPETRRQPRTKEDTDPNEYSDKESTMLARS
jgi:hypothetical protein